MRARATRRSSNALPHSIEAEQGVVGSILQSPHEAIAECVEKRLDEQHFHVPAHRAIYTVLRDMHDAEEPIDLITVTNALRDRKLLESVGGPHFVTHLCTFVPTAANVGYYIEIVRDKYILRETICASQIAIRRAMEPQRENAFSLLDELQGRVVSLRSLHGTNGIKPLIEFRSPLQLKNFTPPPGHVLVGDCHVVRGSVFVEGGPPGVGKSRAAVALAVAGAHRCDWFGLNVHRRFKTMIVQSENGKFRLAREFGELNCDALENFVRICPPPPYGFCFQREDFRRQLAGAIADFKPDIVIVDPWNAVAYEQDSREYLQTFDALRSVCQSVMRLRRLESWRTHGSRKVMSGPVVARFSIC
jgi:DnaB-like helicase N terminal domain/AAA domain